MVFILSITACVVGTIILPITMLVSFVKKHTL